MSPDGPSVAVLVSSRGANLRAMLEGGIPVRVVISDRDAPALDVARAAGVPTARIDRRAYGGKEGREPFEEALRSTIEAYGAGLVVLAGFLRVLSGRFVSCYSGKMVNIHPSLLPAYPGLRTHRRVLEAGDRAHGCTVHWVTEELDAGPVIRQCCVPVLAGDDEETLGRRVAAAEHQVYSQVVREILAGTIRR